MPFSSAFLSQVNLRLILVSGKTEDFTFSPNDSATDIAKHVFDNWPAGKSTPVLGLREVDSQSYQCFHTTGNLRLFLALILAIPSLNIVLLYIVGFILLEDYRIIGMIL